MNQILVEGDDFELMHKTDLAIKIETTDGVNVWLPLSQIEYNEIDGILEIPNWLATEKKLV